MLFSVIQVCPTTKTDCYFCNQEALLFIISGSGDYILVKAICDVCWEILARLGFIVE